MMHDSDSLLLDGVPRSAQSARAASHRPLRVAVVGCGAISQQFHLPILAGHEGVQLAALVDRDTARVRELAHGYNVATVLPDAAKLDPEEIDAAVVATPPSHHAPCAIELMRRGIHVLAEKPMATNYADSLAMVQAAEEAGVVLAVGYFRRLMPSTRMLKALLDSLWLGRPVSFDVVSGGFYNWSAATLGNMRKDLAGGGVLIDFGSHLLDVLFSLFEDRSEVLEYQDNARGGIESDCQLRLRLFHRGVPVEGRVELSRTRNLGNPFRIVCERGTLEFRYAERYRVWVTPNELELEGPGGVPRPFALQASWADEPEVDWYETVRGEIDDWISAIRSGRQPELSGRSALPTARLIEECYSRAQPLPEPWVEEGLRPSGRSAANNGKAHRVLLTGATGFIGSRVAEVLALRDGWQVRALVRRPGAASRLARLPVEMVQGDLRSPADMERALAGCDYVVHCAVGTEYGNKRALNAVTVCGTQNLLDAARKANVLRFVHLSSIAVHDPALLGFIDEDTPVAPRAGGVYGQTKAKAEHAVLRAAQQGLPAVILRPGCVYGPFGQTFVVNPLRALVEGRLVLQGCADAPANTLYVDNLVEAIVRCLEAPGETVQGQVFTLSDPDCGTWGDYYDYFASRLGTSVRTAVLPPAPCRRLRPFGWVRALGRGLIDVVASAESKALLKKALKTDPVGSLPRRLLERFPGVEAWLRRRLGMDRPVIYRRSDATGAAATFAVTGRPGCVRIDKARKVLGYEPVVPREKALELTWEWACHVRLVP
jgi:predicted dehydrogenase/nucleoside-diphosphate-sugar epimerase